MVIAAQGACLVDTDVKCPIACFLILHIAYELGDDMREAMPTQ